MAGLSVILETHKNHQGSSASRTPQIISKATLLHPAKICSSPSTAAQSPATSSFLQRCFLCHRELGEGNDIYMYRGDRAFCSVECRCRQIFMDEDAGGKCAQGAAAVRGGRGGCAY